MKNQFINQIEKIITIDDVDPDYSDEYRLNKKSNIMLYDGYEMKLGDKKDDSVSVPNKKTLINALTTLKNENEYLKSIIKITDEILFKLKNPYLNYGNQPERTKIESVDEYVKDTMDIVDHFYDVIEKNHNDIEVIEDYLQQILDIID